MSHNELHETAKALVAPWELSFSYGRALQGEAVRAWNGESANAKAVERAFHHRAKMNSAARRGIYAPAMEHVAAGA